VAFHGDLILRERQPFTKGDAELPFNEIDARDQLGHGMLDLQARVHLDEKHLLSVPNELDGASTDIVDGSGRFSRSGADQLALLCVECRRRRLLDHLLVSALQRAFSIEGI
jgi:hypothetical protein